MKYEPVDIPKKILDNTQLETIKVLQTIYGEASISKLKYQNGISIVSNYFKSKKDIYVYTYINVERKWDNSCIFKLK